MCKLRCVGVVLSIRVGHHLVDSTSHSDLVRQICSQSSVEIHGASLKVSSESPVLEWKVIVLFLVHLFVDDILLSDTQ